MIVEICLPRNAPSVGQPPHTWPGSPTIGSGPFYCPSNRRPLPVSTATRCSQNRCVLRSAREHRVFSQAKCVICRWQDRGSGAVSPPPGYFCEVN